MSQSLSFINELRKLTSRKRDGNRLFVWPEFGAYPEQMCEPQRSGTGHRGNATEITKLVGGANP